MLLMAKHEYHSARHCFPPFMGDLAQMMIEIFFYLGLRIEMFMIQRANAYRGVDEGD